MSRPLNPWKIQGYKAGQNVICKVTNAEPGGYAVVIVKDNLPGFLPTQAILRSGEDVLAQFVCVHNNRILLSARFSNQSASIKSPSVQTVRWEEQLDQLDYDQAQTVQLEAPVQENGGNSSLDLETSAPEPAPSAALPEVAPARVVSYASEFEQAMAGDSLPVLATDQSEAEAAFAAWAPEQVPTKKYHLRRATDLVLPPIEPDTMNSFKIVDYDLEWLITDLEGGMRTGCVKASSEERLSRSAMLLYRGRAVGCIYGCKSAPDTQPTEQSLQQMLADLELPDTLVKIYDLPENVTLAMSALFLGYPVQRNDDYDAKSYMDYICNWFETKGQTACLAISLPTNAATCLGFVYKGQFCGAFYVEDQKFTTERDFVYDLLRNDPKANVEASILPPEMTSSAVRFGFSLSMARQRRLE